MTTAIESRIYCIKEAFTKKFVLDNSTPDWLRLGVEKIKKGQAVTAFDLQEIDEHNSQLDPTLCSDPTKQTIVSLNKLSNL